MLSEEIKIQLEEARNKGEKIGLVQGSWDLFHIGHLKYLLKARELCDFLIIAMDSDEKIKKRKGSGRPIWPEMERYQFLSQLGIADAIVIKNVNEVKWGLIKEVRPDVLVAIKENYSDEQIAKLHEYCGTVAVLPRQSESSTSDKIRKIMISNQRNKIDNLESKVDSAVEEFKKRIGFDESMQEPIPAMISHMRESTDWICPVSAAIYYADQWYYGTNKVDFSIPKYDIDNRTELFYGTAEHAEINLLKKLGNVTAINAPLWTTLFPCDRCMKVLIDKGVKKIYYMEDHPERNWSKRSHELAAKHNVETIRVVDTAKKDSTEEQAASHEDYYAYKYIYPPNARVQEQLDIMVTRENNDEDPLDAGIIDQDILHVKNYWYITKNRFPHNGTGEQFLIVAKNPVYKIDDISAEMWKELEEIWLFLVETYNLTGGALCIRYGDPALSGASLKRLHVHLIMPDKEKKIRFPIGGHTELKEGLVLKKTLK